MAWSSLARRVLRIEPFQHLADEVQGSRDRDQGFPSNGPEGLRDALTGTDGPTAAGLEQCLAELLRRHGARTGDRGDHQP